MLGQAATCPTSPNQRRAMAELMALSAPIQLSGVDIIKMAVLRLEHGLRGESRSWMLPQIHDKLVLENARKSRGR